MANYTSSLTGEQIENALLASKAATSYNGIPKYDGTSGGTSCVSMAVKGTDYDAPPLRGTTAPSTSTVAVVGQFYVDTSVNMLYMCTAISGQTYTWQSVGGGSGGLIIKGMYSTLAELQEAVPNPSVGDAYAVGTSSSNVIYIWNGTEWKNIGSLKGEKGDSGIVQSVNGISQNAVVLDGDDINVDDTASTPVSIKDTLDEQSEQIVTIGGRLTTLESTWVNIPKSAAGHNAIYRGANLLSSHTESELSAMIQAGTFDDIYIGDYIDKTVTVNGTTYTNMRFRVAGLDTFWRHYGMTTHHVVLVPESTFGSAQMNTSNTTSGGYQGSAMYTLMTTIGNDLNSSFNGGLSLVATTELFSLAINSTATNKNALTGMASSWGWASSRYADIMCEIEVYGSQVWGNGYDTGTGWYQLPIMQLDPTFRCISSSYWLRDIAASAFFAFASNDGVANSTVASASFGVRPRFLIH